MKKKKHECRDGYDVHVSQSILPLPQIQANFQLFDAIAQSIYEILWNCSVLQYDVLLMNDD